MNDEKIWRSFMHYNQSFVRMQSKQPRISVIDEIDVSYDISGKRIEEYSIFASAIIQDIGATEIPSFARIPTVK